jgi:hypothetical protein
MSQAQIVARRRKWTAEEKAGLLAVLRLLYDFRPIASPAA